MQEVTPEVLEAEYQQRLSADLPDAAVILTMHHLCPRSTSLAEWLAGASWMDHSVHYADPLLRARLWDEVCRK